MRARVQGIRVLCLSVAVGCTHGDEIRAFLDSQTATTAGGRTSPKAGHGGYPSDGAETEGSSGSRAAGGGGSGGKPSPTCEIVVCSDAPGPDCSSQNVRRSYAEAGTCEDGQCHYEASDQPCSAGQACVDGACVCNQSSCADGCCHDNSCVTARSAELCGLAGESCSECTPRQNSDVICTGGACVIGSCSGDFMDCNRKPDDGCESNRKTDAGNCGECGKVCESHMCSSGKCLQYYRYGFTGGVDDQPVAANILLAVRVPVAAEGKLVAIGAKFVSTTAQQVYLGLYNDANGHPSALLAASDEITLRTLDLEVDVPPLDVTTGTYWISLVTNGTTHFRSGGSAATYQLSSYAYGALPAMRNTMNMTTEDLDISVYVVILGH